MQISYDIAYIWTLKNNTRECICKIETDSQIQKVKQWLSKGAGKGQRHIAKSKKLIWKDNVLYDSKCDIMERFSKSISGSQGFSRKEGQTMNRQRIGNFQDNKTLLYDIETLNEICNNTDVVSVKCILIGQKMGYQIVKGLIEDINKCKDVSNLC